MPTRSSFDYAVVRVVPRVERGERINAGVIVFCKTREFLQARIELDEPRLRALDPRIDLESIRAALALIPLVCAGDARGGPIAGMPLPERFHWLTAPRSTIVQTSHVHVGLCTESVEPAVLVDELLAKLVRTPPP